MLSWQPGKVGMLAAADALSGVRWVEAGETSMQVQACSVQCLNDFRDDGIFSSQVCLPLSGLRKRRQLRHTVSRLCFHRAPYAVVGVQQVCSRENEDRHAGDQHRLNAQLCPRRLTPLRLAVAICATPEFPPPVVR